MTRRRALLVGAGGFGGVWVRDFLPAFADQIEVVGVADINPETLARAGDALGVPAAARFTEMEDLFAAVEAEIAILILQPHLRWRALNLAIDRQMDVLMEKPIADTWARALDILHLVRDTGTKLAIVQNYPHTNRIRLVKQLLDTEALGRLNYINARFAADYTIHSAGGAFRHQVPYAMLFEGAVHHFDQMRNLAGAEGSQISGMQWNPPWSTFGNPPTALFQVVMTNGVPVQFELNHLAKGVQNGWHHESYRLECEHGAITVSTDDVVRTVEHLGGNRLRTTERETPATDPEGHYWVIGSFLRWLDGGPAPETNIEDNIYTAALTFGAVEAVRTGTVVNVAAMAAAAGLPPAAPRHRAAVLA